MLGLCAANHQNFRVETKVRIRRISGCEKKFVYFTAMQGASIVPPIVWAQRRDRILLTIDLQDVKDAKIKLTDTTLTFSGTANNKNYHVELEFFGPINPEASKWGVLPRHIQMNIVKKESGPYWERLLKEGGKHW